MNYLKKLKRQINIFLKTINRYYGYKEKPFAEEALDMLFTYYFFPNTAESLGNEYIIRIMDYMDKLPEMMGEVEFEEFKISINILLDFLKMIKPTIPEE